VRLPGLKTARRLGWRMRAGFGGVGVILGYHRVAALESDPLRLAVHPDHFQDQMRVLRERFEPVTLAGIGKRLQAAHGKRRIPVAVTFDDGYHDFVEGALPVLEALEVPVTLFALPGRAGQIPPWEPDRDAGPRLLTEGELADLTRHPLVRIGSHTLTHPAMDRLTPSERQEELVGSRRRLEGVKGDKVSQFSYPNGIFWPNYGMELKEAGYELACCSRNALVRSASDPLALPRLWPEDLDGDGFARWLGGWVGRGRAGRHRPGSVQP